MKLNDTDQQALEAKINDAQAKSQRPYSRPEVVEIIRSVLATMETSDSSTVRIYEELDGLARYIENLRSELSQTRSGHAGKKDIQSATDELDAVIQETENATNGIMTCCDTIMATGASEEVIAQVTGIYEACGFQDITGQRIKKVVKTLKHIEEWVNTTLKALGHETGVKATPAKIDNTSLLNGPSLPGNAIDQSEIDSLLASFDK